jgi:hypothetical protein
MESAFSTTALSTQPPLTDPAILPLEEMAITDPIGRGEEPQVLTTVANATRSPPSNQSVIG